MIQTHLMYLSREPVYNKEKPYTFEFPVREGNGAKRTNVVMTKQPVTIHDMGFSNAFTLDANGFCVLNEETDLDVAEALRNPEGAEAAYLSQLEAILHKHFPEYIRLEPFEFVVRIPEYSYRLFFPPKILSSGGASLKLCL